MEVDDYVEHDQYWEEQCARQDMRIEELEKQHAQMLEALNEQLRERVLELETENKMLQLKLAAKYAGTVDDN